MKKKSKEKESKERDSDLTNVLLRVTASRERSRL